jgi:predicted AAA+ superfamily ATPase
LYLPANRLFYWRDKSDREIDFVIKRKGSSVDIIECKINPDHLSPKAIAVFRELYPLETTIAIPLLPTIPMLWKSMASK